MKTGMTAVLALGVGAFGTIVAGVAPAAAQPSFSGRWAVQMVTDSGICDATYRYAIAIDEDGAVRYLPEPGATPPSVSGQVGSNGAVDLGIVKGIARVAAKGKLQNNSGSGSWRLGLLGCSGRWTARKAA